MDFNEKPNLEELRKERENQAHLHRHYYMRFLVSTAAMILIFGAAFLSDRNTPAASSEKKAVMIEELSTREGREACIAQTYSEAVVIGETIVKNGIISVFETEEKHSFCVFASEDDDHWVEYNGTLFPKNSMVKGTAYLDGAFHDIFLLGAEPYSSLLVDRKDPKTGEILQREKISFDDYGIAVMEIKPKAMDANVEIFAYDAEGKETALTG